MFLKLLLLVWSLAITGSVSAATMLGLIVDSEGNPIPRVTISTDQAGLGTIADENGEYGLYITEAVSWVTFSAVGYQPRQFRVGEIPVKIVLETVYYRGTDIIVSAERAESGVTPIAFVNISADQIERDYSHGEFPLFLQGTPNLHSYADAGSSFGYSYIKIRGFDDKRIVTYINGVPLNDPEDQATYFADLPDFATTASDIQIQRGVGNSLYGDGSFGGAINIATNPLDQEQKTTFTAGYGEYSAEGKKVAGIYRQNVQFSSGLIGGRWAYGGRFSKQASGGYRENSWYDGWSYYLSVARIDPSMTTQFETYGGPMQMHLSYWGVPKDQLADNRRFNPLAYSNETDNFNQPHYQLTNRYRVNDNTTLTNTLYYIRGKGYYEQLMSDQDYFEYNLASVPGTESGSVVRQQWVHKNQVGWNPRLDIRHKKGRHSLGGSFYFFESNHWGQVVWAENLTASAQPRHRYYQFFGTKYVGSLFAEEARKLSENISAQVTAQLRYQRYQFDQVKMGAFAGYDYDVDWLFFSPRVGLTYSASARTTLYANLSVASRTPTDASIYEANDPFRLPSLEIKAIDSVSAPGEKIYQFGDPTAKSERVFDYELGWGFRDEELTLGASFFWMEFHDEIVPSGGVTDDGLPITANADRSVHAGLELSGAWQTDERFSVSGNFSYNYNRVKKWGLLLDGYEVDFADKVIPFFPAYIANLTTDFRPGDWRLAGRTRLVGKQYGEFTNAEEWSVDAYAVFSLDLSYNYKEFFGLGKLTVSLRVDNLFDKKYVASGYGGNLAWEENSNLLVGGWAEYFPAAERSIYGQLRLELL